MEEGGGGLVVSTRSAGMATWCEVVSTQSRIPSLVGSLQVIGDRWRRRRDKSQMASRPRRVNCLISAKASPQ